MKLENEILSDIREHCYSKSHEESCGIVYEHKDSKNQKIFRCPNTAEDPQDMFRIDPLSFLECLELGEPICIYHSHPTGGEMSAYDLANSNGHAIPYIMLNLESNNFYYSDNSLTKFLGREFKYALNDCFSIVEDYYKEILGIDFKGKCIRTTEDQDFRKDFNIIDEGPLALGFEKVCLNSLSELQKYDLLVFRLSNKPRHIGLSLSQSFFLHQMAERLSCVELLSEAYQKRIQYIWRHKELS